MTCVSLCSMLRYYNKMLCCAMDITRVMGISDAGMPRPESDALSVTPAAEADWAALISKADW